MPPGSTPLRTAALIAALLLLTAAAVAQENDHAAMAPDEPFAEFVAPADSLPHLRFFCDDQVSLNDRCPVRKVRLNPRMGASYVNDRPVGFC